MDFFALSGLLRRGALNSESIHRISENREEKGGEEGISRSLTYRRRDARGEEPCMEVHGERCRPCGCRRRPDGRERRTGMGGTEPRLWERIGLRLAVGRLMPETDFPKRPGVGVRETENGRACAEKQNAIWKGRAKAGNAQRSVMFMPRPLSSSTSFCASAGTDFWQTGERPSSMVL